MARPGITFAPDTDWQREFDALFPYHETPDQLHAIRAIKLDMESPRPMDRLLCGDVGYGKTEMSIRAAFKAVDNGYQVAVLVPTTILAEQHYHTFQQRMAEFPFRIARLSRFCSPAEEREIIRGLKEGEIDVAIGTHRIASADVEFANLGLVIIDEEQRFGVDVKERLKTLRSTVDVLTMTATPIPRTLHMSLTGVRDISNLETPPEDRLPVETKVSRRDDELVRHAILRELNRGGQVYFVHNRVNDIHVIHAWLQRLVPDADIRVGHGQMHEHDLERVMVDFVNGGFDVLLATTIVESGLDIPNANTIFIDEADRYGLADLHQLRGRVGRYKHRAYCYLLLEPNKHLNPTALRRLRAIEEFSEMGAGFALSMRDLEIRGAGNLLGSQQSGHIAAVGYEFYCGLMEKAVRKLKKLPPKISIDVTIDLPGEAYLPRDYVNDMRLKIDLYRRLTRISGDRDLQDFRAELVDRFGPLPTPAERLLSLVELKIDAAVWQFHSIHLEGRDVVLSYANRERAEHLERLSKRRVRVIDEEQAYLRLPDADTPPETIISTLKSVLRSR
jgi:transcription-repair coupling factor (superfamily II helicase)